MIAQISRWQDLTRWMPDGGTNWDVAFPIVPLGEVLRPRYDSVAHEQFEIHQPITIHFDGSVVARERVEPFKGSMFAAYPGDLIFSKIDARNGAIGLVPIDFDRVVVTGEYPVFVPDRKQVDARYLAFVLRTPNFLHMLKSISSGTSGRKRVNREEFEEIEIPLPDLIEQKRLADNYEKTLARSVILEKESAEHEYRGLREFEEALGLVPPPDLPRCTFHIAQFNAIERWSHEGVLDQALLLAAGKPTEKYPLVALGEVVSDLENGWSPQCLSRPARDDEWGVLKLGAVSFGEFDETANKALPQRLRARSDLEVKRGDVLISRANNLKLVGACAMVHDTRPQLMLCDKIFRVVFRRNSLILPEFLAEILKTPSVRQQIEANATGTSPTMKNISKPALLDLTFPMPDGDDGLRLQDVMVRALRMSRTKVSEKRVEAARLHKMAWDDFLTAIFQ
jgi:type I restriction enzyme, S subunit